MDTLGFVALILFLGGFVGFIAWMVRRERRRVQERAELLTGQGFARLTGPDAELEDRVRALNPRGADRPVSLSNVYRRPVPGATVYLYDALDDSGENSETRREMLGVLAPGLDLPHFCLMGLPEKMNTAGAGLDRSSVVGRIVLRTVDWAMSKAGFERVEYPDDPEFAQKYLVLAVDPPAVDAFLTPRRRRELRALDDRANAGRGVSLMARGDFFVLEPSNFAPSAADARVSPLERLAEAARVLEILS